MEIAGAVGSAFLSSCFQPLFDKLASSELINFAREKHVEAELKTWKDRLTAIHTVLEDAEKKRQTSQLVEKWLSNLRDLAYDVEDMLDLYANKAQRRKLKEESYTSTWKIRKLFYALSQAVRRKLMEESFYAKTSNIKKLFFALTKARPRKLIRQFYTSPNKIRKLFSALIKAQPHKLIEEFSASTSKNKRLFHALTHKLKEESYASTGKIRKLLYVLTKALRRKFNVNKIPPEIKEITGRFEEISSQIRDLGLKEIIHGVGFSGMTESCGRITTSLVCEAKVYGRDEDKKKVLDMLKLKSSNRGFDVISIIGMGGSGKTTLAKLVFNDGSVNFDLKSWVCVGENFDVTGITKTILQKFSKDESCTVKDLDSLQISLKEKSRGKKLLIVLDDVWDVKNMNWNLDLCWNLLCSPFEECAAGSKIIVTTRHVSVSQTMGSVSTYTLPLLSKEDCLSLLAQCALQAKNFDEHPSLKDIGEEIAQRCKGLPLAAVIIGGLLIRQPRRRHKWEAVLGQWNSFKEDDGILSVLKLSYYHLPSHLKRCFAYCAVFPKDYEIKKDVLIQLWMAEGLLSQSEELEQHKIGVAYFDELLSRSLFQISGVWDSEYVMHDLVNDLACSIAGDTCINSDILKGKKLSIDVEKVRYLSIPSYDISRRCDTIKKMKHLRTFLCMNSGDVLEDAISMLQKSRYLRALSLRVLPTFVGQLRLLRYIHLFNHSMKKLPESLGDLLGLQTLILESCWSLRELPTSIGKLVHLGYLDMSCCFGVEKLPESLGDLLGLQKLILTSCGTIEELPTSIGKLVHLEYLGMSRCTSVEKLPESLGGLVNLETLLLQGCSGLKELPTSVGNLKNLHFLDMSGCTSVEKLPESLGDLINLQTLKLNHCRKLKELPSSIENLKKLDYLNIEATDSLQEVPTGIGNLVCVHRLGKFIVGKGDKLKIRELKDLSHHQGWLQIEGLHNVVDIEDVKGAYLKGKFGLRDLNMSWVDDFYDERDEEKEMEVLQLLQPNEKLENLRIKFYGGTRFPSWIVDPLFGKLVKLSLIHCKKIKSLPALGQLPALKTLWIEGLEGVKSVGPEFYGDGSACIQPFQYLECLRFVDMLGWEDWISAGRGFPYLRELTMRNCPKLSLEIIDCPSLVPFPKGCLPPNLVSLEISGCKNLTKPISEWGLDKLSSLAELSIDGTCLPEDTVSFPNDDLRLPSSLIRLQICKICKLESIPMGLLRLISLKTLVIGDCPELQSLPCEVLPSSLKVLLCVNGSEDLKRKLQEERQKYPSTQIRTLRKFPNAMPLSNGMLRRAACLGEAIE